MAPSEETIEAISRAYQAYRRALRQGLLRHLVARVTRGCNDLVSFDSVAPHVAPPVWASPYLEAVPLERIVGSAGRVADFDLAFLPRREATPDRWQSVARAFLRRQPLPPVRLYRVQEAYFVMDGHHRISVARAFGETALIAQVVALDAPGLAPAPACRRLGFKV